MAEVGESDPLLPKDEGTQGKEKVDASFAQLLKSNRSYRLYMLSMIVTILGEWFTYIASISAIETLAPSNYTALSILVFVRVSPVVLFSAFGGVLSDSSDRRLSMIRLDILGAVVGLLYLVAVRLESLKFLFAVSFIQQSIAAFYEPVRGALLPMMVPGDEMVKKAITLSSMVWSSVTALGTAIGGFAVANFGYEACFLIDSVTYLMSAYFIWLVRGKWSVMDNNPSETHVINEEDEEEGNPSIKEDAINIQSFFTMFHSMLKDGTIYVTTSFFGPLVLMKSSTTFVGGAVDVLNVSFSVTDDEKKSTIRLGLLFAYLGLGAFVGPLIADFFTEMSKPRTLQMACIVSIGLTSLSLFILSWDLPFWAVLACTVLWAMGGSVIWTDSSLLLQKFSSDEMYGRVTALSLLLANLTRSISAFLAGLMHDDFNMTPQTSSLTFSILTSFMGLCWLVWHLKGGGACSKESDDICEEILLAEKTSTESPRRTPLISPKMDTRHMSWVSVTRATSDEDAVKINYDRCRYSWVSMDPIDKAELFRQPSEKMLRGRTA